MIICQCTLFAWINLSKSLYILIVLFVINVVLKQYLELYIHQVLIIHVRIIYQTII